MSQLTAAQRKALEAVRDGEVTWFTPWSRHTVPRYEAPGIRSDVIQRVVDARLARVGSRVNTLRAIVELTDAGREALDA